MPSLHNLLVGNSVRTRQPHLPKIRFQAAGLPEVVSICGNRGSVMPRAAKWSNVARAPAATSW